MIVVPSGPHAFIPVTAQDARVVDDLAVHDGENGPRPAHVGVAHTEVVAIEDHQIGELADLDRAEIAFSVEVPGIGARVRVERLLPADLLPGIDLLAEDIEAGRRVVHRETGVTRRDVDTVLAQARWDAARDDLRVERSEGQSIRARDTVQPGEPGHGSATI